MRILLSTVSAAHYMAPPILSDEQVNCGPFFPDRIIDGRVISLSTGKGEYDLSVIASRLPADQQPEAIVCLVDSSWFNVPKNLAAFKCPKIALIADTHHMTKPILGMLNYLSAQKFDRHIFLYTRHHLELFRAAGMRNLHWLPGLTFPHNDAAVRSARKETRIERVALIGQAGGLHQRRLALAGALAGAGLPLVFREGSQREAMDFYGSSLVGFNASANADLNLRAFEITSAGSLLLMDRLAPESGVSALWRDGKEYVGYDDAADLVERARHFLARPDEARSIGTAAARWFDEHLNAARRRHLFDRIVSDGRDDPMFALPAPSKFAISPFGGLAARYVAGLAVYEHLQKLHSTAEIVRVQVDDTVPADFGRICATLPRLQARKQFAADETPDCLVTSTARALALTSLSAPRIWCWDAAPAQFPQLVARFKGAGLTSLRDDVAYFGLPAAEAGRPVDKRAAEARNHLQQCDAGAALEAARRALQENPQSVDAYLVMADLALEVGKGDLFAKMIAKARELAPDEPRVPLLELASRQEGVRQRPAERLMTVAMRHVSGAELGLAWGAAQRALKVDPALPSAWYWSGQISLRLAERQTELSRWRQHGSGLNGLRRAVELAPQRADYCYELGIALRQAGLFSEAAAAFERSVAADPHDPAAWFALGEVRLKSQEVDRAVDALEQGLQHAPGDHNLLRWLGHARKRQGRLEEATDCYLRAHGFASRPNGPVRSGGKRRVVFAVQHGPAWTCTESIYRAFAADPAWEAIVVALPYQHPFYNQAQDETNAIFTFLHKRGVPYVSWDAFRLGSQFADVVFLQNPYDVTRPMEWRVPQLLAHGVRLAYLPYGLEIGGGERNNTMVMNLPLQQMAWMVFARSERQKRSYADHCLTGNAHVAVTGHPKLDALDELALVDSGELKRFAAGRKLIAWNPHFDIRLDGSRFGSGFSTFLRWWEFLLEEFARRPDLALVIRPHPLFFGTLEDRGILTQTQIKAYLDRGVASGILFVDRNPSHLPLFAVAEAMMSDISSFVLEFSATGKPLLYLHNPQGLPLNDDADFVHKHLYKAERESELVGFLDHISAGRDPLGEGRRRAFPEYMHRPAGGAGAAVKRAIEARLSAETAPSVPEQALVAV